MIEIQNNKIIRDGVDIGQIEGGTAYVTEKQPPRVVGQIRAAAGNPDLVVSVMGKEIESPQEIGVTVEVPDVPVTFEPAPEPPKPAKWNLADLPPVGDKSFSRAFINVYGPDEYAKWQKSQA